MQKKWISCQNHFKIQMGVAHLIFELHPWNFQNHYSFWRCSNYFTMIYACVNDTPITLAALCLNQSKNCKEAYHQESILMDWCVSLVEIVLVLEHVGLSKSPPNKIDMLITADICFYNFTLISSMVQFYSTLLSDLDITT